MQELIPLLAERWLSVFIIDLARYLIGVCLVLFFLFVVFRRFSQRRLIQARRPSRSDLKREIGHSIKSVMVYATVALLTVEIIKRGWTKLYSDPLQFGYWYLLLSVPLLLVLHDAYFYWMHRLMHSKLLFKPVHRLHHLSKTPTAWAAYSFSIWEAAIMALFVPIVLMVLPVPQIALFTFLAIMIVRNAMGHSGVEFHPRGWIESPLDMLTTVTHHDLHHQHYSGNYGLYFTWWDRLMGTELPEYKATFREVTSRESTTRSRS